MPPHALPVRLATGTLAVCLALAGPASGASLGTRPPAHPKRHHRKPRAPKPAVTVGGVCPDAWLVPTPANLARVGAATLCLVDQQRAAARLAPLQADAALTAAAARHSLDMVAQDYLGHLSPSGAGPLERLRASGYILPHAGYDIAENITAAVGDQATPAATVALWMGAPDFRANILSPTYRDTGIGVAPATPALDGDGPGATYTQDFATTT